jgi:hypothetical protein
MIRSSPAYSRKKNNIELETETFAELIGLLEEHNLMPNSYLAAALNSLFAILLRAHLLLNLTKSRNK